MVSWRQRARTSLFATASDFCFSQLDHSSNPCPIACNGSLTRALGRALDHNSPCRELEDRKLVAIMPEAAAAPAQQNGGGGGSSVGMFLAIQFVTKNLLGVGSKQAVNGTMEEASKVAAVAPQTASISARPLSMPSLKNMPASSLVLEQKKIPLNDYSDSRDIHATFPVPTEVQNNGTLWAHIYVAQSGSSLDPTASQYDSAKAYHFIRPVTQHLPKKKVRKVRNLLSGLNETEAAEEDEEPAAKVIASYYHPNFTMSLVPDYGVQSYVQMHPATRDWMQLEATGARDASGQNGWYYPVLYLNTFWQLRNHMTELNDTVKELPINIHLNHLANWKFGLLASMDFGMKENAKKIAAGQSVPGGGDGSELEDIKRILLDSNLYLLATTVVVGILHTVFEMLAFKNDIGHFRNKKDNVGVSVRTIVANVVQQGIIFLYLMDNNENTSWMILLTQGMGILVEAWKITRTVDVRIRATAATEARIPWRYLPYTITFEDKHKLSETEKKTQEYDEIAFRYLYIVAIPLLGAYAVYSLIYETHKSWYSFVITTLVGSVYAYGFLMMVPSLYINYRLKSVAHMPGKAMMYKVLNTFIDDLFAFTIKMPTLHRLATLRDDVVFFIYLYQSWVYRVDKTRVNEFGQGGDEEEVDAKLAAGPLKSPAGGQVVETVAAAEAATTTGASAKGYAKKRK
ncbi:hypothetical protein MRB53_041087 [Persea americana]|nr:hypothetical protein MRB53_041087 [Persea americana]